ncbi:hypothetical protein [Polymorphospora sp. NPDC050346]|uniref:hypothetical protein n=1 Tax=Polymorphospora sp. NPDC050346 TaxID=3155780 RepID=UPI0033F22949
MSYTGETYQQALTALQRDGQPLPSAYAESQQRLEAEIMVSLACLGESNREWLPSGRRWWAEDFPLTITRVHPLPGHLELEIPDELLKAFCWAVMPVLSGDSFLSWGSRGLITSYDRNQVVLHRADDSASVRIRSRPHRWDTAMKTAAGIPRTDPRTGGFLLNPRWARNDSECRFAGQSLVASELLRRAALFVGGRSAHWIATWNDIYLLGPLHRSEWLPDPVPAELAKLLTDSVFGVRIPKPAVFTSDEYTVHKHTHDPRFMTGPVYEDMI